MISGLDGKVSIAKIQSFGKRNVLLQRRMTNYYKPALRRIQILEPQI